MPPEISIIVPLYNESDNVIPLAREIAAAMHPVNRSFEIVLVDDASRDGTSDRMEMARAEIPAVRGIRHRRNAGQSAAVWSGICASEGRVVATLDGDCQNDPADLPKLLAELENADMVCGVRRKRQDHWVRKVSSKVARAARRSVLGVDFEDTGCALRVFRREALRGVFPFNGLHRFLPVIVHGGGFVVKEVEVNHRPRSAGASKYGVWNRLGRGMIDLLAVAWYQRRRLDGVDWE